MEVNKEFFSLILNHIALCCVLVLNEMSVNYLKNLFLVPLSVLIVIWRVRNNRVNGTAQNSLSMNSHDSVLKTVSETSVSLRGLTRVWEQ